MNDQLVILPMLLVCGVLCGIAADWLCDCRSWPIRIAVAAGILMLAIWARLSNPNGPLPASYCLAAALIVLTVTDLRLMRLPDLITLPLVLGGLTLAAWIPGISLGDRLLGGLAGYGCLAGLGLLYRRATGRDGLGLGDAKLTAAAGTWLGWAALPSVILIGSIAGLAWALLLSLQGSYTWRQPLPFGPALAAAFWLVWLYGPIAF